MSAFPPLEGERERLAAVHRYQILDTPPDGAFDRITALAARLIGVPIAIVSIVDEDRIWFKSHHGLDVEEIGRDPGLCASAILRYEPLIIPDARVDPVALTNPLVAGEFGLRFYAAAPLTTSDRHNLGTLCVIDQEPRELDEEEVELLEDLAALVVHELELRLAARTAVAEEQMRRAEAVEEQHRADEERQALVRLHTHVMRLADCLDPTEALERAICSAVELQGASMGVAMRYDPANDDLCTAASVGFGEDYLAMVDRVPRGVGACGTALAEGRRVLIRDVMRDERCAPLRDAALLAGYRAVYSVPLRTVGGRIVGALATYFTDPTTPSEREQRTTDLLAQAVAQQVDNAQLYEERAEAANTLQRSLLPPSVPDIPGVAVAASYHPAGSNEIGGDFYDIFERNGSWFILVGDVCGKGVQAAALTSLTRHTLRTAALLDGDPGRMLGILNDTLLSERTSRFCTAVVARLDAVAHGAIAMTVATGGHEPPLVLSRDGRLAELTGASTLIGVVADARFAEQRVELGPGQALLLYTDGAVDVRRDGVRLEHEDFKDTVRAARATSPHGLIAALDQVLALPTIERIDDAALVAVGPR